MLRFFNKVLKVSLVLFLVWVLRVIWDCLFLVIEIKVCNNFLKFCWSVVLFLKWDWNKVIK